MQLYDTAAIRFTRSLTILCVLCTSVVPCRDASRELVSFESLGHACHAYARKFYQSLDQAGPFRGFKSGCPEHRTLTVVDAPSVAPELLQLLAQSWHRILEAPMADEQVEDWIDKLEDKQAAAPVLKEATLDNRHPCA